MDQFKPRQVKLRDCLGGEDGFGSCSGEVAAKQVILHIIVWVLSIDGLHAAKCCTLDASVNL